MNKWLNFIFIHIVVDPTDKSTTLKGKQTERWIDPVIITIYTQIRKLIQQTETLINRNRMYYRQICYQNLLVMPDILTKINLVRIFNGNQLLKLSL